VAVRRVAACLLAGAAVAGCGTTGSTSTSAVTATGRTLSIWLSQPPGASAAERDVIEAEKLAFAAHSNEVTHFSLRLRVAAQAKLSDSARQVIQDTSAIAYLGELAPGASEQTVGITNGLDLLQVSPTDNAAELTSSTSAVPGAPGSFYESLSTYGHTFAAMSPSSVAEAAAQVTEMQKLGVHTVYATDDGSNYGRALVSALRGAAGSTLTVASSPASADAMFYAGAPTAAAGAFRSAAAQHAGIKLFGSSSLEDGAAGALPVEGGPLYVSVPAPGTGALPAGGFVRAFRAAAGHAPAPQALFGYAAMSAVLQTLAEAGASANNRNAIVRAFHQLRNRSSVIGTYSIGADGATTLRSFSFERLSHGAFVPVKGSTTGG
jgi:ABC-type branched-subunit amino acid transport system substrate-binding protein